MAYSDINPLAQGLARAKARQAPKGYAQQSAWAADYGDAQDDQLMMLYRRRQQDRLDAENADRSQRQQQTGLWEPSVQNSFNMGGFFEGAQHNDAAAGIDAAGHVVAAPKDVMLKAPRGTPYQQGTRRLQRGSIANNQAYSIMALRDAARPTIDDGSIEAALQHLAETGDPSWMKTSVGRTR